MPSYRLYLRKKIPAIPLPFENCTDNIVYCYINKTKGVNVLKNNKGFSLIELMVVVAIIAILSTIAIPSYQTFQAKARQKEGFALAGGYFQSAHAARAEYEVFPGNFVGTGFAPNGTIRYDLAAMDNGMHVLPYMQNDDATCIQLSMSACTCGGNCANYMEWLVPTMAGEGLGVVGSSVGWVAPAMAGAAQADATTFDIFFAGVINTKAAMQDEYQMDEQKTLTLVTDGLK